VEEDELSVLSEKPQKATTRRNTRRSEENGHVSEDSRAESRVSKSSSNSSRSDRKTMPIEESLPTLYNYTFKKVSKIVLEAGGGRGD
jgi:hypothetical protein